MHLAIFLDLLTPIKLLSLITQQEVHDSVNSQRHQGFLDYGQTLEFNW